MLVLIVLLVCLPVAGYNKPFVETNRFPTANDLARQVTIRRDTFGVPHLLAKTEPAAAFGHGFVSAEDHGPELARLFLKARSEEAMIFGEQFAESDFATKELRLYEFAESGFAQSPPWVQAILDGFAAGYNRYLDTHRSGFPAWASPINGIDVLAHARRVILMEFAFDLRQVRHIGQRASLSPSEILHGSNMWGIGKGRSASGKGILLANPHLAWSGSQLFYETHITVPGKINISGSSLIGTPGIAIGFNEFLGWSHTVNSHDSDDLYELTLDPKDRYRYLYDGDSLPIQKREITIQVKTDTGRETRKKEAFWCHYGPVLKWDGAKAYAFKSANIEEYRFVEQWNLMGKARNLAEFRKALDIQALPMFNISYTDREGNVFYIFNGRFPERPEGFSWPSAVPGNSSASEWNHILPQSRLPFLVNPSGGYVQNCNSAPWYTNLRSIIDRRQFPEYLTPNFNDLRSQLSLEMLEGDESISLDEVLGYKYNLKLLLADRVKGDLLKLAQGRTIDGVSLDDAAGVLQSWDNTVSRESTGSMLFVTFWTLYRQRAKPLYAVLWDERHPASTPHGIGDNRAALQALADAIKAMKSKYGSLTPAWGDLHRLRRGNLDVSIGGFTGDFGAFRIIGYREDKDGRFVARGGDSYVLAVEFTSPPTAYSIVAYSQTDDLKSPHHTDQSALFAQEKWKRAWFTEEDIAKNLERSYQP